MTRPNVTEHEPTLEITDTTQLEELENGSGISRKILARARLRTEHSPKAVAKLTGFPAKVLEQHGPFALYPYYVPQQRDPVLVRVKPATPLESRAKYISPKGSKAAIYFTPPLLESEAARRDVTKPLLVTEGEKKALSAASHGFSCVALAGVSMWHEKGSRVLHPHFEHITIADREVFVCFDRDALDNNNVRREEHALADALSKAGARVYVVRFPEDCAKLDDLLVSRNAGGLRTLIDDARARGAHVLRWEADLSYDEDRLRPTLNNAATILIRHPLWMGVIGFDERGDTTVFRRRPPLGDDYSPPTPSGTIYPRALIDADVAAVAIWLEREFRVVVRGVDLHTAIDLVARRTPFDPFRDHLEQLPPWDGEPRVNLFLIRGLGARDTPYAREVARTFLLGAVARTYQPGAKVDTMPVLFGAQGIGKSSAVRALLHDDSLFCDRMPDLSSKDAAEQLRGRLIIELAELTNLRRSDVETVKAFLSRDTDVYRAPYARHTISRPRRVVFVGTTNSSTFLVDETGNRRFLPVEVGVDAAIDLAWIRDHRDQLWAEAWHRIHQTEAWWTEDPALLVAAVHEQAARYVGDAWEEPIMAYLERPDTQARAGGAFVTVGEVLKGALKLEEGHWSQADQNRVARVLRSAGCKRVQRRGGGRRMWVYAAPSASHQSVGDSGGVLVTGESSSEDGAITTVTSVTALHRRNTKETAEREEEAVNGAIWKPNSGGGDTGGAPSRHTQLRAVGDPEAFEEGEI